MNDRNKNIKREEVAGGAVCDIKICIGNIKFR